MECHKDSLRVLSYLSELSGEVATIHVVGGLIEAIATSIDLGEVGLHLGVGISPTAFIVVAVEEWTCPKQQHAAFQG